MSNLPFTFQGNRGGKAEDAELLAELMAISQRSNVRRFETDDGNDPISQQDRASPTIADESTSHSRSDIPSNSNIQSKRGVVAENKTSVPPSAAATSSTVPDLPQSPSGIKSDLPKTFRGDRGGVAEDADLLAELRAISAHSSSADRFATDDDNDNDNQHDGFAAINEPEKQQQQQQTLDQPLANHESKESKGKENKNNVLPPWKRKGRRKTQSNDTFEISIAATPPSDASSVPAQKEPQQQPAEPKLGIKSTLPKTFNGNRGGAAEDADLLAELRAISAKSSSTDRFVSPDDNQPDGENAPPVQQEKQLPEVQEEKEQRQPTPKKELPPWKRKGRKSRQTPKTDDVVDVVVSAPPPPASNQAEETTAPLPEPALGLKSDLPKTFRGDRGGSAEDADLLAELRAISSKSSSTDRFASPENEDTGSGADATPGPPQQSQPAQSESRPRKAPNKEVPPWKRKGKKKESDGGVDVVVSAAPPKPSPVSTPEEVKAKEMDPIPVTQMGIKSNLPQTFRGDRGGTAEDADLLAELRAISNKSSSADRFVSPEDGMDGVEAPMPTQPTEQKVEPKPTKSEQDQSRSNGPPPKRELPPWKRKGSKATKATKDNTLDVVVAPPPPSVEQPDAALPAPTLGIKSELPKTFRGDRGGSAEDADLLAELRAISSKSSSADRFVSPEDGDAVPSQPEKPTPVEPEPKPPRRKTPRKELPPWKRKSQSNGHGDKVDVSVTAAPPQLSATPTPNQEAEDDAPLPEPSFGIKSDLPKTFKGDRGGSAEDADLLAELRAISSASSSGKRFVSQDSEGAAADALPAQQKNIDTPPKRPPPKAKAELPPWKRKGKFRSPKGSGSQQSHEIYVNASQARSTANTEEESLASQSTPTSPAPATKKKTEPMPKSKSQGKEALSKGVETPTVPSLPPTPSSGIKTNLPFTFKGERGGTAEDADLLAQLRAISMQAGGKSRFAGDDDNATDLGGESPGQATVPNATPKKPVAPAYHSPQKSNPLSSPLPPPPMPGTPSADEEIEVTRESLEESIRDKDWKVRKQSYIFLKQILEEATGGAAPGNINARSVFQDFPAIVLVMVRDSNAGALDCGLQCALSYANHCRDATSEEAAKQLADAVTKGNALASSRASTVKNGSALLLKLMEVGSSGAASVHSVVDVLLENGLSSKKPKVVLAASSLVHEAVLDFGAGNFPLASIKSSLPKMLSHSNVKVRDVGMKVLAEICRTLGSKAPLQDLVDSMKKAQVTQLDTLLQKQPQPSKPRVGLRNSGKTDGNNSDSGDAMAAFEEQARELEAKRLAARPAVNIFVELPKTEYSNRLKLAKWSEKVGALDILLECGGEKPYKLSQPSSSVNYAPLVSEMRKLLGHTHFAVASKAMQVVSMFAEGVGERLYPNLRPLLSTLVQLAKDKKLTKAVGSCLDTLFGNILSLDHLVDKDDSIPAQVDEKKQKNALARISALEYLARCVQRGDDAGPRGKLSTRQIEEVTTLACVKVNDTDAGVRKAATALLKTLLGLKEDKLLKVVSVGVDGLEKSNPRIYKSLKGSRESKRTAQSKSPRSRNDAGKQGKEATAPKEGSRAPSNSGKPPIPPKEKPKTAQQRETASIPSPDVDQALQFVQKLGIPLWDADEDDGGVYPGLKSQKWLSRHNAIQAICAFCRDKSPNEEFVSCVLALVKSHTKGFKDTNFTVMKSVVELFCLFCEQLGKAALPFPEWASKDAVYLATEKAGDRKLSTVVASLLTNLCVVYPPSSLVGLASTKLESVRAPTAHEAFLKWLRTFCVEFGCMELKRDLKTLVSMLLNECGSSNLKVRTAALGVFSELHVQLGPSFKAVALSMCSDSGSTKGQIESCFESSPFDPAAAGQKRQRSCVVSAAGDASGDSSSENIAIDIPKTDLIGVIGKECISKLGSKDGKNAWKLRKEALDEIESALKRCNGLLATDAGHLKSLVELLRALRERLTDSQSNLKPIAARLIGKVLSTVDKHAQGRLGKVVFAPLVGAAVNDNRKPMREASLDALKMGTKASEIEGGAPNEAALESYLLGFVGELAESEYKAGGLPDVLSFTASVAEHLPNIDSIQSARAQPLGEKFAAVLAGCMTSSKSDTRSNAETLLKACVDNGALSAKTMRKSVESLKPAQQRTVAPIISKVLGTVPKSPRYEKENQPARETPRGSKTAPSPKAHPSLQRTKNFSSRRSLGRPNRAELTDDESPKNENAAEEHTGHPLKAASAGPRTKKKNFAWPEYPEEPNSPSNLSSLRKHWSQFLPPQSLGVLFPSGGIKKQDDAKKGCELLSSAMVYDREEEQQAVTEQVDLILKWISVVLCSRENTVGLQALLSLQTNLFIYLGEKKYVLTEDEAMVLLPHILEKGSNAKGRFRDLFDEIIETLVEKEVISTKCLGGSVCANVIERSPHAKARVLAYQHCARCVQSIGLSGIGKRGLLTTAKMLADESIAENKTAALNLIMTILSKMNGDIDRLARICSSNLSDRSRKLVEEKWNKSGNVAPATTAKPPTEPSERRSQIPTGRGELPRSSSDRMRTLRGLQERNAALGHTSRADEPKSLQKTPFSLRLGRTVMTKSPANDPPNLPGHGPFSFSFDGTPKANTNRTEVSPAVSDARTESPKEKIAPSSSESKASVAKSDQAMSPGGAAASLRARLQKIKQKHLQISDNLSKRDLSAMLEAGTKGRGDSPTFQDTYNVAMETFARLCEVKTPVRDDDALVKKCTSFLKQFHASISSRESGGSDQLRSSILENVTGTVSRLTRVIRFAFENGDSSQGVGMPVPLLSVALATLMTLFRDSKMARLVQQDDLSVLIKETGKCLLDPRLAVSAVRESGLDESTTSQMVRGMNKLAVSAATGAARHISLQALMSLQEQLCLREAPTPGEAALNGRLSRIVTKLFSRTLKSEESNLDSFSQNTMDLGSLLSHTEDFLDVANKSKQNASALRKDAVTTCRDMGNALIGAILNSRPASDVYSLLHDLKMDNDDSYVYSLVQILAPDPSVSPQAAVDSPPASPVATASPWESPQNQSPMHPSQDVAALVSAVGRATEGPERITAVNALKRFREEHGDRELNAHLDELSPTFRSYIVEQLDTVGLITNRIQAPLDDDVPMSERIRKLRSKLKGMDSTHTADEAPRRSLQNSHPESPMKTTTTKSPTKSMMSLRQRLALAQENRSKVDQDSDSQQKPIGHAAALRARLEAARKLNK